MPATDPTLDAPTVDLSDGRYALVGKFAGLSKRAAQQMIRQHGGKITEKVDESVDVIVLGEAELPKSDRHHLELLEGEAVDLAIHSGKIEVIDETELWQRLGLVGDAHDVDIRNLYTPAMLAELLQVPTATVRRWHRRGLIQPRTEIRRLPYFDFQEIINARTLASLLAEGISPSQLERKLGNLEKYSPGVKRRLAQLTVIVEGKDILLREGEGLIDGIGQFRFDFDASQIEQKSTAAEDAPVSLEVGDADTAETAAAEMTPKEMLRAAAELEDENQLQEASLVYRTTLAAYGPDAEVHFRLAELLYRMEAPEAARERYYAAIEIDEDFVEARANLGCVLYELGDTELAFAAWNGALAYHPDYADVHLHLARSLDEQLRPNEGEQHWQQFLHLAPESPWAEQARQRLYGEKEEPPVESHTEEAPAD